MNRKTSYHTLTTGHDPQANGTAERSVGLIKPLAARALASASLDHVCWSYVVVLDSDGQTRFKWMQAGRKELDNLTNTETVEPSDTSCR